MKFTIDAIEFGGELIGRVFADHGIAGIDGLVYGRNGDVEIPIESIFKTTIKITSNSSVEQYSHEQEVVLKGMQLRLVSVNWYRKEIDVIPQGHTACLQLEGEDLSKLAGVIGELREKETLVIQA